MGTLIATDKGVAFEDAGATTFVDAAQIVKLSTDDERYMKGGAFGQVMRTGVPFAGGLATGLSGVSQSFGGVPFVFGVLAAAFTQSRADVVTLEYFDPHDGRFAALAILMIWQAAKSGSWHSQ